MKTHRGCNTQKARQAGFSLIEMMVVIGILTVIMGAIFSQIDQAQRNASTEQMKLDLFQQTREFTDQMARDLRGAGYPNTRNYNSGQLETQVGPGVPAQNSELTAVGLVKLDVDDLWFETAQSDGSVWVIRYRVQPNGANCPCLERSQTQKVQGDPVNGQTGVDLNYVTEVQHVENGTTDDPIFTAYYKDGTKVPLPIEFGDEADKSGRLKPPVADVNSIEIRLTVRSPQADQIGNKPSITMISTVRLSNCSQAFGDTDGTSMGC